MAFRCTHLLLHSILDLHAHPLRLRLVLRHGVWGALQVGCCWTLPGAELGQQKTRLPGSAWLCGAGTRRQSTATVARTLRIIPRQDSFGTMGHCAVRTAMSLMGGSPCLPTVQSRGVYKSKSAEESIAHDNNAAPLSPLTMAAGFHGDSMAESPGGEGPPSPLQTSQSTAAAPAAGDAAGANPAHFGHNAFVASRQSLTPSSRPASKAISRARSTLDHKGSMEAALRDAAQAAAGSSYHSRDMQRQFADAGKALMFPASNVHEFVAEYASERVAQYEVSQRKTQVLRVARANGLPGAPEGLPIGQLHRHLTRKSRTCVAGPVHSLRCTFAGRCGLRTRGSHGLGLGHRLSGCDCGS